MLILENVHAKRKLPSIVNEANIIYKLRYACHNVLNKKMTYFDIYNKYKVSVVFVITFTMCSWTSKQGNDTFFITHLALLYL